MKLKTHLAKDLEWKMKLVMLEGFKTDPGQLGAVLEVLFLSPDPLPSPPLSTKGYYVLIASPASCKMGQVLLLPVSKLFSINLALQGTSKRKNKEIILASKAC